MLADLPPFGSGLRRSQDSPREPALSHLFLPFTGRVSPRLARKREPKPTAQLLPTGEMPAKVPLTVLSLYRADAAALLAAAGQNKVIPRRDRYAIMLRQAELELSPVEAANLYWRIDEAGYLPSEKLRWACHQMNLAKQPERVIELLERRLRSDADVPPPVLSELEAAYLSQQRPLDARRAYEQDPPPPTPPRPPVATRRNRFAPGLMGPRVRSPPSSVAKRATRATSSSGTTCLKGGKITPPASTSTQCRPPHRSSRVKTASTPPRCPVFTARMRNDRVAAP